jgi:hypothetical protein
VCILRTGALRTLSPEAVRRSGFSHLNTHDGINNDPVPDVPLPDPRPIGGSGRHRLDRPPRLALWQVEALRRRMR